MGRGGSDSSKYNVGVISEWFYRGTDYSVFLSILKPGDLVEFERQGYQHWAVYIGDHALAEGTESEDQVTVQPCIVHRANPTDNPENLNGLFSASRSLSKGSHGIGDVVVEPLLDVWRESGARINNSLDNTMEPYPSEQVVLRALSVVHGEDCQAYTQYNVLTNNCEHFVSWCRNGWSLSCQVAKKAGQLAKLGLLVGAAAMPRPLALLAAAAAAGAQILSEVRRYSPSQSQSSGSVSQLSELD